MHRIYQILCFSLQFSLYKSFLNILWLSNTFKIWMIRIVSVRSICRIYWQILEVNLWRWVCVTNPHRMLSSILLVEAVVNILKYLIMYVYFKSIDNMEKDSNSCTVLSVRILFKVLWLIGSCWIKSKNLLRINLKLFWKPLITKVMVRLNSILKLVMT